MEGGGPFPNGPSHGNASWPYLVGRGRITSSP